MTQSLNLWESLRARRRQAAYEEVVDELDDITDNSDLELDQNLSKVSDQTTSWKYTRIQWRDFVEICQNSPHDSGFSTGIYLEAGKINYFLEFFNEQLKNF